MKVRTVMTTKVETCPSDADLARAAMMMWNRDCGALPVTRGAGGRVVGMITDRDICMAVATRRLGPHEIRVSEVMNGSLHSVTPEDDIHTALERMAGARVRRLPVVGPDGRAMGILSLNDMLVKLETTHVGAKFAPLTDFVMRTLKAVSEHRAEAALGSA